jgi:hypothetical protein
VTTVPPQEIIAFLVGIIVANVFRALVSGSRPGNAANLSRLERKLDMLLNRSGMDNIYGLSVVRTMPTPDIEALLRQGKKIQAIKVYREQTGMGLKESKDAVEEMARLLK